ncbi:MAG: DUF177 domain-containing protein [Pseudomonadota bacterium]
MQQTGSAGATVLRVADLAASEATRFDVTADGDARAALAAQMGILGVRKLRFSGEIAPAGKADWRLTGTLGATVVQACVVTLEPVTTRVDEPVERLYLAEIPPEPEATEVEMPEDDTTEALGDVIDLHLVMAEALALALPMYPRAADADLEQAQFAGPGVAPMTDEDARPFAGLKELRDKLDKKG